MIILFYTLQRDKSQTWKTYGTLLWNRGLRKENRDELGEWGDREAPPLPCCRVAPVWLPRSLPQTRMWFISKCSYTLLTFKFMLSDFSRQSPKVLLWCFDGKMCFWFFVVVFFTHTKCIMTEISQHCGCGTTTWMERLTLRLGQKSRLTFAELHLCCPAVVSINLRWETKLEKQTQNLSPACK